MPEGKPQRQMVDMEVVETSGVDHPAHGHEGWLVRKSAGRGRVAALNRLLKGTAMPKTKEDLIKEVDGSKLPEPVKEYVKKSIDLTPEIDAAAALWDALRTKQEAEDPNVPSPTDGAQPAPAPAPSPVAAAFGPDVFKALGAEEQEALAKAAGDNPELAKAFGALAGVATAAMQKAQEERDARLDAEAIAKSRDTYTNLSVEHETLAPALRKMAEVNPELAEVVTKALEGANVQIEASGLFKELGSSAAVEGSAMQKAQGLAAAYVTAGTVKTIAEGLAKAFEENPALYTEYEKEVG